MHQIPFENEYLKLGEGFYTKTQPTPVAAPVLIRFNRELADELGLPALSTQQITDVFSGNRVPRGVEPLATVYAGHQFGQFVPQLGDGRAILLGELVSPRAERFDIQLKGSGPTVYSRNGDGRAALGPVLREYLLSEAMLKLKVPTTRALAAVSTGEQVLREQPLPGAIITRVAQSFVRVGSFQYFASREDSVAVQVLADHVIARNYPELALADNSYLALLQAVVESQAALIARWMQLGFIHGVMNTDNMSIAGETIDYGPCAFMDAYDHYQVFSSIDRGGRYAYGNQPSIGLWNLSRLAECLLPLLDPKIDKAVDLAKSILEGYIESYQQYWLAGMRTKCGLTDQAEQSTEQSAAEKDKALVEQLLDIMSEQKADFTLTFYYLSQLSVLPSPKDDVLRGLFERPESLDDWLQRWRQRLSRENHSDEARQSAMQAVNPVYIPRNHRIEAAIRAAEDDGDFSLFHELFELLQNPFVLQQGKEHYRLPPKNSEMVRYTYCGT